MAESPERRVQAAAAAALSRNRFAAPIDVLTGLAWLRRSTPKRGGAGVQNVAAPGPLARSRVAKAR